MGPVLTIPSCKLHPQHSAGLDTLSTSRPGVNRRPGARRNTIIGCSGLKYRSKMLIIPELKQASLDNSVRGNNYSQLMRVDAVPVSVTTSQSAVLIIRCVPVNHDVSGKMTGSRLPPFQFNSPSPVHKKEEEGVTCAAIWFRYESIIMDSGTQCLDCAWVLTSAFFPRKARIYTDRNCNVMMTLRLRRRHDDAVTRLGPTLHNTRTPHRAHPSELG